MINRPHGLSTLALASTLSVLFGCSAPERFVSESVSGNGGRSTFDVGKSFRGLWLRESAMIEFVVKHDGKEWRLVPDGFERKRGSGEEICFAHLVWPEPSATALGVAKSCFSRNLAWAAFDSSRHKFTDPAPHRGELFRSIRERYAQVTARSDEEVMGWLLSESSTEAYDAAVQRVK